MKQHQHSGGTVGSNSAAGTNGGAVSGPPGSGGSAGMGPSQGAESHVHGGLPPRDCWSHQPPTSHHHHHQHHVPGHRAPEDDPSPPRRDGVDDDDDEEQSKKPLQHLLQLQTAMHRYSPPDHGHHHGVPGTQLKAGTVPSYRGSPPPLHPVAPPPAAGRYHHAQHGTPMASPIHAWPDPGVDMLAPGLQQQQQRLHVAPASNQLSPYHSSAYMMSSAEMASTYQSWYAGSAQQLQQPAHHLSTLLS